jgi:hypothetical protein
MKTILDWLQHNKEWVFSGIGVTAILGVIAVIRWLFRPSAPNTPPRPPGLQVNLAFGFLTCGPELSDQMLLFTVGNPSERPTQLTGIRLPMKNGGNMVFPFLDGEKRLPCMIEPATSSRFWVKLSGVEERIRSRYHSADSINIHAVATDGVGNDYAGNSVTIGHEGS